MQGIRMDPPPLDEPESASEPEHSEISWQDLPQLMDDLRDMARRLLKRWPGMTSLQPTLLVNTALRRQRRSDQKWEEVTWETRRQLFAHVFRAMHHKLVEYRRHQATPGYIAQRRIVVSEMEDFNSWRRWTAEPELALALEVSLERLHQQHPELAELVEYRFFAGLTWSDIAKMQGCSLPTVKRRWEKTRVLMQQIIQEHVNSEPGPAKR